MANPVVKINKTPTDNIAEILGYLGLLLLIAIPVFYYSQLPDQIPSHFGFTGAVDAYSQKASIWMLPAVGIIVFIIMKWAMRKPHTFNYPEPITPENAADQYSLATRTLRLLIAIIIWFLVYITYSSIQTAFGNQDGLNFYISIFFVILIIGAAIYPVFWRIKK